MGADLLSPLHLTILLAIAVLLFGSKRLPEIGRSLGSGMREFKDSISGITEPVPTGSAPAPAAPVSSEQPAADGGSPERSTA